MEIELRPDAAEAKRTSIDHQFRIVHYRIKEAIAKGEFSVKIMLNLHEDVLASLELDKYDIKTEWNQNIQTYVTKISWEGW